MTQIIPLKGRRKRLKSLDEFEPPAWARRPRRVRPGIRLGILLALFAASGALIGLLLPF